MRVLVVDEHDRATRGHVARLRADGHAVDTVRSIDDARSALRDVDYDCLVVGTRPPDDEALALVAESRRQRASRPVLVIASGDDPDRRIAALEAGADDHLSRPVNLDELSLRVRKLIVRVASPRVPLQEGAELQVGPLALHRGRREVTLDGRRVALTPTQYALLDHLLTHHDRVVSTAELLDHCWDWNRSSKTNPLPVQMSRLRRAFRGVVRIDATRGVGYRLSVLEPTSPPAGDPARTAAAK